MGTLSYTIMWGNVYTRTVLVQLFRKKWEKNWASTKKLFDTPLKGGGGGGVQP